MPNPIDLQKSLGGVNYPARKDDLVEHARKHGANDEVVESLKGIPDKEYDGPDQVQKEVF
jgi:hypothetical protein